MPAATMHSCPCGIVCFIGCLVGSAAAQPVVGSLAPHQAKIWGVDLRMGQYVRVSIEVMGTDVDVTLVNASKQVVRRVRIAAGAETALTVIADVGGRWAIKIRASPPDSKGQYSLRKDGPRQATARDRIIVQAEAEFLKSKELAQGQTAESQNEAIEHLGQALALWGSAGDRAGEANSLIAMGDVDEDRSEFRKALDEFNSAFSIRLSLGDRRGQGEALKDLAGPYFNLGDRAKSLDCLQRALAVSRADRDVRAEAEELSDSGVVYSAIGDEAKAAECLKKSLILRREIGDRKGEGITLTNLGQSYDKTGKKRKPSRPSNGRFVFCGQPMTAILERPP